MYTKSKDYNKLLELVKEGKEVICYIDYYTNISFMPISRDICKVKKMLHNKEIQFGVRGMCYTDIEYGNDEKFLSECTRLNVEWIVPQEEENIVFKTQLEIIQAYRNKIIIDKLSIEDVISMLDHDYEYLEQQNAIIITQGILNK